MEIRNLLFQAIKEKGYVNISQFMEIALTLYPASYYRARNPFEGNGDFITSPEISQMFGEMIGIWIYNQWEIMGKPKDLNLVEFGPGQGILMRDLLRVITKTDMKDCFSVLFYDVNPELISKQKENLAFVNDIRWVENLNNIPDDFSFFIANEFFDALPINQYVKEKQTWKQVILRTTPEADTIIFDRLSIQDDLNEQFNYEYKNAKDGAIIEESVAASEYIRFFSHHAKKNRTISLIIDYGYDMEPNLRVTNQFYATLQAIKDHNYTPILKDLGQADLSAHVDFYYLKKLAEYHKVKVLGSIPQRDYLQKLGIEIRLAKLIEANVGLKDILQAQYERLVSSDKMGELFKVLCISNEEDTQFIFDDRF